LKLTYSTHFKKDYQVIQKSGRDISQLDNIIRRLGNGDNNFAPPYKIYPMDFGWMKNYFTLYLAPDWALIYKIDTEKKEVYLVRTGHPKDIQH
jgi:addiction module RelE/StbE family toxin